MKGIAHIEREREIGIIYIERGCKLVCHAPASKRPLSAASVSVTCIEAVEVKDEPDLRMEESLLKSDEKCEARRKSLNFNVAGVLGWHLDVTRHSLNLDSESFGTHAVFGRIQCDGLSCLGCVTHYSNCVCHFSMFCFLLKEELCNSNVSRFV